MRPSSPQIHLWDTNCELRIANCELLMTFSRNIRTAQVVMKGFNVRYNNGDHHILEIEMDIDTLEITGPTVRLVGDFVFRDSSGTFDDPYSGFINFVVIADLV